MVKVNKIKSMLIIILLSWGEGFFFFLVFILNYILIVGMYNFIKLKGF